MVHPLAGPSAASANQTWTGVPGCNKQPLKHMLVLLLACIVLVENQKIDWYYAACRPRLVKAMTEQLEKMQNQYDALANQMSEATVHPEAMDQPFVYIYGWLMCTFIHYENSFAISDAFVILASCFYPLVLFPRSFRNAVQQNFVNCTKLDVGMNSLVQRSKILD